jgi:hypothetical protein
MVDPKICKKMHQSCVMKHPAQPKLAGQPRAGSATPAVVASGCACDRALLNIACSELRRHRHQQFSTQLPRAPPSRKGIESGVMRARADINASQRHCATGRDHPCRHPVRL